MKRVAWLLIVFAFLAVGSTDANARRSRKNPNEIVYVLNIRRPNVFHHHSCSRVTRRDAFAVRRWWAEDKGAREHSCFRGR